MNEAAMLAIFASPQGLNKNSAPAICDQLEELVTTANIMSRPNLEGLTCD